MVRKVPILLRLLLPVLIFLMAEPESSGQTDYNSLYFYRFYLKDKGGVSLDQLSTHEIFSERSVVRRTRNGVAMDNMDIPVYKAYIDTIENRGLEVACTSRWINTITASSEIPINIEEFSSISFIESILMVKSPLTVKGSNYYNKKLEAGRAETAPPYWHQLEMHGTDRLHEMGFTGTGIVIAVIDGGFTNAGTIESLSTAFEEGRIVGTYDFVKGSADVFNYSMHGTSVLSILAATWPGFISGSAPGASYLLLRSEEVSSEYPVEEDFWVAAAEYADSAGADIISTSLGYSVFTDGSMDHTYSQMDGNTIFISQAAGIAWSRGMVVVTSAGNERNSPWYYITAPADGKNVIAVGAVDQGFEISAFSSSGPSYDHRIKPDVATMGVAVTNQRVPSSVGTGNGTSYSCPLLSGMIACLMQALPGATHEEIGEAVKISADRYLNPDNLYGYGIANIYYAYQYLSEAKESQTMIMYLYPNPTSDRLYLRFNSVVENVKIRIFDLAGRIVIERNMGNISEPITEIAGFSDLAGGTYIVKVVSDNGIWTEKIIKTKE